MASSEIELQEYAIRIYERIHGLPADGRIARLSDRS